jgi:predicted RNase H-like nuclease (RuvC/YqgF family)
MHTIVGIDTGKTMAFVCLDLQGVLVKADHAVSSGTEWVIDAIGKVGIPSIIACDRTPNYVVRKIAASFNARIFYPKGEMSINEKMESAKPFGITNPHERDACAAAVKAYRQHSNKLKQAEHIARVNKVKEIDKIKAKVIERYSIDEAITGRKANRL